MNFEETTKMVFKDEKGKYTIGLSNKKQDGSYENAYFPIQFNKGVELQNKTQIRILKAWLSFYKWEYQGKKGTSFMIRCTDFEDLSENKKEEYKDFGKSEVVEATTMEFTNDELPF